MFCFFKQCDVVLKKKKHMMFRGSYPSTVSFKSRTIYVNTLCVHNIKHVLHGPGLLEKLLHVGP